MRDRFSWYASAFIIWMIAGFFGLVAMAVQAFENLFDGGDESSAVIASGSMVFLAAAVTCFLAFGIAWLLDPKREARAGFADAGMQAAAVAVGGVCAVLYGAVGVPFLVALPFLLWFLARTVPKPDERPWIRRATVGLIVASAAPPILIVLL